MPDTPRNHTPLIRRAYIPDIGFLLQVFEREQQGFVASFISALHPVSGFHGSTAKRRRRKPTRRVVADGAVSKKAPRKHGDSYIAMQLATAAVREDVPHPKECRICRQPGDAEMPLFRCESASLHFPPHSLKCVSIVILDLADVMEAYATSMRCALSNGSAVSAHRIARCARTPSVSNKWCKAAQVRVCGCVCSATTFFKIRSLRRQFAKLAAFAWHRKTICAP